MATLGRTGLQNAGTTLRAAAAAALVLAPAPTAAQRLEYRDLYAQPAPRLPYADLGDEEAMPVAPAPATAAATDEAGVGPVREYYLDRMEASIADGSIGYAWDVAARIGGPRHRLWLESIGEGGASLDYLEMQALYSRAISATWDLQAGLRYDVRPVPNRAWLAVGAQGNASEELYLGLFAFVSQHGEVNGRIYGLYDVQLAPNLVLQPSGELDFFSEDVPALGLGRGLAYSEAELRLRYHIRPWFAPYVGVSWVRSYGRTAQMARAAGDDVSSRSLLLGLRSWF